MSDSSDQFFARIVRVTSTELSTSYASIVSSQIEPDGFLRGSCRMLASVLISMVMRFWHS